MAAVRTGDVVIAPQRLAHTHRYSFFSTIQMSQAGHFGGEIQLVDMLFEKANLQHLLVHDQPKSLLCTPAGYSCSIGFGCFRLHHIFLRRPLHVYM